MNHHDADTRRTGAPPRCYVITHERSGTHLMINLLIKNSLEPLEWQSVGRWFGPYDRPATALDHVHRFNRTDHGPTIIAKWHADHALFEHAAKCAPVIYVYRDPRDVLMSWWEILNHRPYYANAPHPIADCSCDSFSAFLHRPANDYLRFCYSLHGRFTNVVERLADHLDGWLNAPDRFVVRYEQLVTDPSIVHEVASHIDLPVRDRIEPVRLGDMWTAYPRRGVIGDWRYVMRYDDEHFVREMMEARKLDWKTLIA